MMPSAPLLAADAEAAVLGVERSLCGRRWLLRPADDCLARVLAETLDVPPLVARMLAARGVGADAAADFCAPTLRRLLPDPRLLRDMPQAAERVAAAVRAGEAIAVFGDYDVDGATASALLVRFFRSVGLEPSIYIPDRIREGYGPNVQAMRALAAAGARLVITVDCGTSAHEALAEAQALGLEVVVVDHHEVGRTMPPAAALINPNRDDDASGQGHLAAVGVAFLLVVEVNRRLREQGFYRGRPEPDLRQWLDLVALGTACDMVPLRGVNRAFVSQGLKIMARGGNAGIRALGELIDLRHPPAAFELGFMFGPRVNAGGRVGEAGMGARLLSTEDAAEARALAVHLDGFNRERQRIEAGVLAAALEQLEGDGAMSRSCLTVAAGEDWHPGVIGIVASRLVERFAKPAIVVSLDEARGVGSGRSVPGRDLGAAVHAAIEDGVLIKGGGHPMAAGFSVARDRLGELAGVPRRAAGGRERRGAAVLSRRDARAGGRACRSPRRARAAVPVRLREPGAEVRDLGGAHPLGGFGGAGPPAAVARRSGRLPGSRPSPSAARERHWAPRFRPTPVRPSTSPAGCRPRSGRGPAGSSSSSRTPRPPGHSPPPTKANSTSR